MLVLEAFGSDGGFDFGVAVAVGAVAEGEEFAAVGGEIATGFDGAVEGEGFGDAALGEDIFDPGPFGADGADVGATAQAAAQAFEAGVDGTDAGVRHAIE